MRVSDFERSRPLGDRRSAYRQQRTQLALARLNYLAAHTFRVVHVLLPDAFRGRDAVFAPNEQTPTFKVKRVSDSNLEKSSADQINSAAKPNPDNTDVQLPDEKKSFDKLLQDVQASRRCRTICGTFCPTNQRWTSRTLILS